MLVHGNEPGSARLPHHLYSFLVIIMANFINANVENKQNSHWLVP